MAKNTVHEGPTNAELPGYFESRAVKDLDDLDEVLDEANEDDEEDKPSPGNSSEASTPSSEQTSRPNSSEPAPTTESHSSTDRTDSYSAGSTDSEPPPKNASKAEWSVFVLEQGYDEDPTKVTRDQLIEWWEQDADE